jgi:hypothetical protein
MYAICRNCMLPVRTAQPLLAAKTPTRNGTEQVFDEEDMEEDDRTEQVFDEEDMEEDDQPLDVMKSVSRDEMNTVYGKEDMEEEVRDTIRQYQEELLHAQRQKDIWEVNLKTHNEPVLPALLWRRIKFVRCNKPRRLVLLELFKTKRVQEGQLEDDVDTCIILNLPQDEKDEFLRRLQTTMEFTVDQQAAMDAIIYWIDEEYNLKKLCEDQQKLLRA